MCLLDLTLFPSLSLCPHPPVSMAQHTPASTSSRAHDFDMVQSGAVLCTYLFPLLMTSCSLHIRQAHDVRVSPKTCTVWVARCEAASPWLWPGLILFGQPTSRDDVNLTLESCHQAGALGTTAYTALPSQRLETMTKYVTCCRGYALQYPPPPPMPPFAAKHSQTRPVCSPMYPVRLLCPSPDA